MSLVSSAVIVCVALSCRQDRSEMERPTCLYSSAVVVNACRVHDDDAAQNATPHAGAIHDMICARVACEKHAVEKRRSRAMAFKAGNKHARHIEGARKGARAFTVGAFSCRLSIT